MRKKACSRCRMRKPLSEFDGVKKGCRSCLRYYKMRYANQTPKERAVHIERSKRGMRRLKLRRGFIDSQPMWSAVDANGHIQATWYSGCTQPFLDWKKAIAGRGYRPVRGVFRQVL